MAANVKRFSRRPSFFHERPITRPIGRRQPMDIIPHWGAQPSPLAPPKTVLTIGTFDGLHLGHQYLIEQVLKKAAKQGARSLVLTFDPHPLSVLAKTAAPPILTTFPQKADFLADSGLDALGAMEFNKKLAAMEPVDFLHKMLERFIRPVEVVIGPDFGFGRNAEGNLSTLENWGRGKKVRISVVTPQSHQLDGLYASSQIRQALRDGLIDAARRGLGRPYRLAGLVSHGQARGRLLGFPTANLTAVNQLIPGPGVYAVLTRAATGETPLPAMCSIGYNPTFGAQPLTVETHLLDFDGDLYGQTMTIDFIARLRPMIRFKSVEALVEQMKKDEQTTRALLREASPVRPPF